MGTHESKRRRSRMGPVVFFAPLEGVEACFVPISCLDPDGSSQRLASSSKATIPIESRSEFWRRSNDWSTKVYRHRVCKIRVYGHRVPKVGDGQPDGHQTGLSAGNSLPIGTRSWAPLGCLGGGVDVRTLTRSHVFSARHLAGSRGSLPFKRRKSDRWLPIQLQRFRSRTGRSRGRTSPGQFAFFPEGGGGGRMEKQRPTMQSDIARRNFIRNWLRTEQPAAADSGVIP
jgi:hypothetical protein